MLLTFDDPPGNVKVGAVLCILCNLIMSTVFAGVCCLISFGLGGVFIGEGGRLLNRIPRNVVCVFALQRHFALYSANHPFGANMGGAWRAYAGVKPPGPTLVWGKVLEISGARF